MYSSAFTSSLPFPPTQVDDLMNEADVLLIARLMACKEELGRVQGELNLTRNKLRTLHRGVRHPVGTNWEARFDNTGRVKFLDHEMKFATWEHPPLPEKEEGEVGAAGWTVQQMPEYTHYQKQVRPSKTA